MQWFKNFIETAKLFGYCACIAGTAFSISLCGIGLGIYAGALVLDILFFQKNPLTNYPHKFILLGLCVSLIISVFVSPYFSESIRGFGKYLQGFILLYAGIDILKDEKKIRFIFLWWALIYFIASFDALVQLLRGTDFLLQQPAINEEYLRLRGPYHHSNDFSSFLIFGVALFLSQTVLFFKEKKKSFFIINLFSFFLIFYIILRTMSRGGTVSAFSIFVVFFILCGLSNWRYLLGAIFLIVFFVFVPKNMITRFHVVFDLARDSNSERLTLARIALDMIHAKPFFGLGLNTYAKNFLHFRPATYTGNMSTHNSYLQMTAEFGLVGFFFYAIFLLSFIKDFFVKIISSIGTERIRLLGVFCGIIGFLTASLFDSTLQSTKLRTLFWLLIGLGCALTYTSHQEPKTNKT